MNRGWLLALACVAGLACEKQPLVNVNAGFAIADGVWFEEEETLFLFYRVDAEQGLRPESQVEITWTTDAAVQPWTPLTELTPVHTHLPVDCGYTSLCGSMSVHVPQRPRNVEFRLRYHRDGEIFLGSVTNFYEVGPGPAPLSRSLLIYGVLDEDNERVQWRARHQFPNLRNMEAEALGLRRYFRIANPGYGPAVTTSSTNPYGYIYDTACDPANVPLGWAPLETTDRAIFDPNTLPIQASSAAVVCAVSTVTDATGTFNAVAIARKNPEVRPAFPELRSPIRENTPVGFVLRPCQYDISGDHYDMQVQRLLLTDAPVICVDGWNTAGFANQLAATLQNEINAERALGNDMVVTIALHHDLTTPSFVAVIEDALNQVLVAESLTSSPHVSGAFLLDSYGHEIVDSDVKRLALWCPAVAGDDLDDIPPESLRSCPVQPDIPDLKIGPFKLNTLPILPTRAQYLTFIDKYGVGQAGSTKNLQFLAPEHSPLSDTVAIGEFGAVTFFDDETISAQPSDAFSFCALDPVSSIIVFRSANNPVPLPIQTLPEVHQFAPESTYELGLFWEFPFLLRLKYEVVVAGVATAFDASVPFGVGRTDRAYFGAELWRTGEFSLDETLLQCTRFCDHPTFDSAGVYNVQLPFRTTFALQCYQPVFPKDGDGGFPLDP